MCCLSKILECSSLDDIFYEWNFKSYRVDFSQIQDGRISSPPLSSSCIHQDLGPGSNNPCNPCRSFSSTDIAARCGSPVMPRASRLEGRKNGAPLTSGIGIAEVYNNNNTNNNNSNNNSNSGLNLVVKTRKTLQNILLDTPESCKKEEPMTSNITLPGKTNKPQEVDINNIRAQPCNFLIPFEEKNSSILRQLRDAYIKIGK